MKGIVEINKVYRDGTKELICRDNNILTDGLGVTLGNIFTDTGDVGLKNHLVGYFQVGTGRLDPAGQDISKAKYISTLHNPVTNEDAYGKDAELKVEQRNMVQYHPVNFSPSYQESWVDSTFVELSDSNTTKTTDGIVNYRFTLTENMLNNLDSDISEFGLFIRDANSNIRNDQPLLIAYKNFANGEGISKNKEFAITIDWKLQFITDSLSSGQNSTTTTKPNVVFIMLDDVGVDHLGLYDDINPIDLTNAANPNARPVSEVEDSTNGKNIYPYMPTLSAIAAAGMKMYNVRTQPACSPTRAVLLTGKYNCSNKNIGGTGKGYWGPGFGMVAETNAKRRGGLRGLNEQYRFLNIDGELENLNNQVTGADAVNSTIASQDLLGDHCREKLGYKSAMFGKWHLGFWSDTTIYCEPLANGGEHTVKGTGWEHLHLRGKWDHYFATFTNLNSNPIPGVNPNSGLFSDSAAWPNYDASTFNIGGKTMGFVNYFVSEMVPAATEDDIPTYVHHTISDTDYVTFSQSASGEPWAQGAASSYCTNYILSAASAYYNQAEEPFFMYISPNVPHTPYTYPPSGGVYTDFYNEYNKHVILQNAQAAKLSHTVSQTSSNWITANAMLENFDFQLSAFLQGLNATKKANTIFIVTSDNGAVGPDIGRRAAYASSIGLGSAGPTLVGGDYTGSGGLGATYDKMLNLGAYCSGLGSGGATVGDTSGARRGGESDSANQFKASLYDRAMLVPMVVSGVGVQAGVSTSALIDINDILATITDMAGADPTQQPEVPPDSISFYDILTGKTDASSHARQYSYGEVFFPIGNSVGALEDWGPYSGFIGCGDEQVEGVTSENPDPRIPRRRRQAFTVRFDPSSFSGKLPGQYLTTLNYLKDNGDINDTQYELIREKVDTGQIPDVSGGLWKILRPSSGKISGVGADFDRSDFPDPEDDGDLTPFTIGKGAMYEELYHLQSLNFSGVDLYELNDYLREYDKGVRKNHLASSLIVSAVKLPEAGGGINSGAANGGALDNTVHYWNLARIFDAAHRCLIAWNSGRYTPEQTMSFLTDAMANDEDETP